MTRNAPDNVAGKRRLPPWLKKRLPASGAVAETRAILRELGLETVCQSAHCPNLPECFARHTATFMILGSRCTRSCRFCAVDHAPPEAVRDDEPEAVAEAAHRMKLRHVVVTSVTRDDLLDGGAAHFARVVRAVRRRLPRAVIEVLTPDFQGAHDAVDVVLDARPDIFNHNVETVPRLYPDLRPQADYARSLAVLRYASERADTPHADHAGPAARLYTKSGLMVGCGETRDELADLFADLRGARCDILTIGQYLAPSDRHYPVKRFLPPEEFREIEAQARAAGFLAVASGPFVRSSYNAAELFESI